MLGFTPPSPSALLGELKRRHLQQRDALVRQYVNARTAHIPHALDDLAQGDNRSRARLFSFTDACHTLATGLGFHSDDRVAAMNASQASNGLDDGRRELESSTYASRHGSTGRHGASERVCIDLNPYLSCIFQFAR